MKFCTPSTVHYGDQAPELGLKFQKHGIRRSKTQRPQIETKNFFNLLLNVAPEIKVQIKTYKFDSFGFSAGNSISVRLQEEKFLNEFEFFAFSFMLAWLTFFDYQEYVYL